METGLGEYTPQIAALLTGGLTGWLGTMLLARTTRGRALMLRTKAPAVTVYVLTAVAVGGGALYWLVSSLIDAAAGTPSLPSPGPLALVGLCFGLALSIPGVVISWSNARAVEKAKSKRRDRAVTKDDRREYAADLAKQISELSYPPREVRTSIGGDGGRVLELEGDFSSEEGERLTQALREDLKDVGFKRVEGKSPQGDWWSRV